MAVVALEFPAIEPAVLFWVSPMAVLPVTLLLGLTAALAVVAAGGTESGADVFPPATLMESFTAVTPDSVMAMSRARSRSMPVGTVPVRSAMPS